MFPGGQNRAEIDTENFRVMEVTGIDSHRETMRVTQLWPDISIWCRCGKPPGRASNVVADKIPHSQEIFPTGGHMPGSAVASMALTKEGNAQRAS